MEWNDAIKTAVICRSENIPKSGKSKKKDNSWLETLDLPEPLVRQVNYPGTLFLGNLGLSTCVRLTSF